MTLSNLLWFYRRRIRARWVAELFALLGIAAGVALLYAVQVANTSLSASIGQLREGIVGDAQLQLVARGPNGFDERLVDEAARIDGVRAVAPVLELPVNAVGPRGERAVTLLAADTRLARMGGELLSDWTAERLAEQRAVVLPAPVAHAIGARFGMTITLEAAGRRVRTPVGALVGPGEVGPLATSPAVVAPLAYGQAIAGTPGRVSRVVVRADQGRTDDAEAGLRRIARGRVDVRSADFDIELFRQAALPNDQSVAFFAGISALVGFLFAFNAMLLMARERRGVIAELRMSGYRIPAVVQVLIFDALVLGTVAATVGIALGEGLSRLIFHPTPGYLAIAFTVGTERTVHWEVVALALASGMLAAVLATMGPLVAALRAPALDVVEDDETHARSRRGGSAVARWRVLAGVACLAVTTVVLLLSPTLALLGVTTLVAAMMLFLPSVLAGVLAAVEPLRRTFASVVPTIAIGELRSARSRSLAIAAIAAIGVFGGTAIEGAHRDLQAGLDPNSRELNDVTDLWVSARGAANTLATTPFRQAAAVAALERTPHVAAVAVYRGALLDVGDRRTWVIAPPRTATAPIPASQVVTGDVDVASARIRAGGWATVSEALARQEGLRIGRPFTLRAPRPTTFRLAAITTNFGWTPGTVVINADDFRRAWDSPAASALQVKLDGLDPAAGERTVRRALAGSGLAVETALEREERHRATTRDGLARLTQIATLLLVATGLAVAAATGGMVWQRRRRLADLKLAGVHYRQLWKAVLLESALLVGTGCAVGAVFGIYGVQIADRALNAMTGFPVDHSPGFAVALTSLAGVAAVATAIATVPGWLAARVPANVAFRD